MVRRLLSILLLLGLLTSSALADGLVLQETALTDGQKLLRGWNESDKSYVYLQFGSYPFEKNGAVAPCLWRVLAIEEGYALLLNEYVVDFKPFHTVKKDQPEWNDYLLYTTMNTDMLSTMFTPEEQSLLRAGDELGRLFILDNREFMTHRYGFRAILTEVQHERNCSPTPYAAALPNGYRNENGNTWYWSRTCRHTAAGGYEHIIGYNGHISMAGFLRIGGVRPACYVDIGSLDHATGTGTLSDPYVFQIIQP